MELGLANRDVIAIGASAGGVNALRELTGRLPGNLPAAVLVTLHLQPHFSSSLDVILSRSGQLAASFAERDTTVERGRIYIAPPDYHLLLSDHRIELGNGPRENYSRPAIDPMFRSVALCCGRRSIGVVLTGTLGDGASGLLAIKETGGIAVVQDPRDAEFPDMPARALDLAAPDYVVPIAGMADLLVKLVQERQGGPRQVPEGLAEEVEIARSGRSSMDLMDHAGRRSVLTCPDCGGIMWEISEGNLVRYRCHVGHAYNADLMSVALDESLRRSLASALRALEERASVARRLYQDASRQGRAGLAPRWAHQAAELEREAETIRDSIRRIDRIAAKATLTDAASY